MPTARVFNTLVADLEVTANRSMSEGTLPALLESRCLLRLSP